MNNSIIEFLINNNARISNGNAWMVVNKVGEDTFYTIYSKSWGERKVRTLYDGLYFEVALNFLTEER